MKSSESIQLRLEEAKSKKEKASSKEISYFEGLVDGLQSAHDAARIAELENNQ